MWTSPPRRTKGLLEAARASFWATRHGIEEDKQRQGAIDGTAHAEKSRMPATCTGMWDWEKDRFEARSGGIACHRGRKGRYAKPGLGAVWPKAYPNPSDHDIDTGFVLEMILLLAQCA